MESSGRNLLMLASESILMTHSEISRTFLLLTLLSFIFEFWEMLEIEMLSILENETSEKGTASA